jgi:hypothetical protein
VARRTVVVSGERRAVDFTTTTERADDRADDRDGDGWFEIARVPLLERPLRVPRSSIALLAPFGRRPRAGFRELTEADPRLSRLWGRFSVDVGVALERDAKLFAERVFSDRRHRMFIVEDGDRYAIRGMCVFTVREEDGVRAGEIVELLHDRSIQGLLGASHVLGLALRAMSDDGAELARAWSFTHSGSFPLFARHAFFPRRSERTMRVRADDRALADFVRERRHWYASLLDSD